MNPEGIIVFHAASGTPFKMTLDKNVPAKVRRAYRARAADQLARCRQFNPGFFAMISFLAYLLFLYATSQQG